MLFRSQASHHRRLVAGETGIVVVLVLQVYRLAHGDFQQAVEGARTATELARLADRYAVDMPISGQVNCVLTGQSTPREAVQSLLNRDPRTEEE